jgi:hypothetical protein
VSPVSNHTLCFLVASTLTALPLAAAYQARFGVSLHIYDLLFNLNSDSEPKGCKGLWHIPVDYDATKDNVAWLEVRESQHKCDKPSTSLSFGVIRRSAPSKSTSIGPQALAILRSAHTSASQQLQMEKAITSLQEAQYQVVQQALKPTSDPCSLISELEASLRSTVDLRTASAREGKANAWDETDSEDADIIGTLNSGGVHHLTGRPDQWELQAIRMLQSGFAAEEPFLLSLLENIRSSTGTTDPEQYYPVPRSRHAFVVADHTGTLKENEVFFQSSVSPVPTHITTKLR